MSVAPPTTSSSKVVGHLHGRMVHGRRIERLATAIEPLVESRWHVLDVGCGDGRLARGILDRRADVECTGVEVQPRPHAAIAVTPFDGKRLPFADEAFDAVLLVDVLHHTDDPAAVLAEARRVSRRAIILKDHRLSRPLARPVLRFMDWVGNRHHDVPLPYNYWPIARWRACWQTLGLIPDHEQTALGLYPWPASWLFETGLHFLVRLRPAAS